MERYKLKNGDLCPPPRNGVSLEGRAFSNFAARVARDEDFAVQNNYYPKSADWPPEPEGAFEVVYTLCEGAWHCHYETLPSPTPIEAMGAADDFV